MSLSRRELNDCLRIALRELPDHGEYDHFSHWTFIYQGGRRCDWAKNSSGLPPRFLGGYAARLSDGCGPLLPKRHSELNAFMKCRGLLDFRVSWEAVNIRLNRTGNMKNSHPCECCWGFLRANGCERVYFSTEGGWAKTLLEER